MIDDICNPVTLRGADIQAILRRRSTTLGSVKPRPVGSELPNIPSLSRVDSITAANHDAKSGTCVLDLCQKSFRCSLATKSKRSSLSEVAINVQRAQRASSDGLMDTSTMSTVSSNSQSEQADTLDYVKKIVDHVQALGLMEGQQSFVLSHDSMASSASSFRQAIAEVSPILVMYVAEQTYLRVLVCTCCLSLQQHVHVWVCMSV
jgi:hypothetical protein